MPYGSSRREFLKTAAGGVAGLQLLLASRGAFARSSTTSLGATVLADNVVQITGLGTNAVLVVGADGSALVVDSGPAERAAFFAVKECFDKNRDE